MKLFANLLAMLGATAALSTSSSACYVWFIDEPECPTCLIEE